MGGVSSEREISLKSGQAVFQALKKKRYDAVCIDTTKGPGALLKRHKVDIAFISLHGRHGEDGAIQGLLEVMEIPYTGSGVRASAVAMDKIMTKELLTYHGVPTPSFEVVAGKKMGRTRLHLPVVVKPAEQGSTIGITRVGKRKEFEPAVRLAKRFNDRVLVEEYVCGREVTVGILDDIALPVVEVRPMNGFYDYRAKYTSGQTEYLVPAPISKRVAKKVQKTAITAHQLLGCRGVSRVDLILDEKGIPYVLEVNTIPGMTETSLLPKAAKEAGISFEDLVERILKMAVPRKS